MPFPQAATLPIGLTVPSGFEALLEKRSKGGGHAGSQQAQHDGGGGGGKLLGEIARHSKPPNTPHTHTLGKAHRVEPWASGLALQHLGVKPHTAAHSVCARRCTFRSHPPARRP